MVEACTGLAVPGRPIGPWSQRTGAPEDVRDRTGPDPRSARGPWRTGTTGARADVDPVGVDGSGRWGL
jgi:hypothetical protein